MQIVLDASVAVAWGFPDEQHAYAIDILERPDLDYIIPSIFYLETAHAFTAGLRRARLTPDFYEAALRMISILPCQLVHGQWPDDFFHINRLATEHQLAHYDAWYLHLALSHKAPLASLDQRLTAAARQLNIYYG